MSAATEFPPSIPFQVHHGSLELKKDGSPRFVWNGSWPKPGTTHSMLQDPNGVWNHISSNSNTVLPHELVYEWVAIASNSEMIEIVASGARASGIPLLGRGYDLRKWFRQLPIATTELWKFVVHANGGFREDQRMQMGRAASAHSGQRTSFLIAHLLQTMAGDQ